MSTISNNDIAKAIYLSSKDKSAHELVNVNRNILNFLYRKRLLSRAKDILRRLEKIINNEEGRLVVRIKTREELKDHSRDLLKRELKERYKVKEIQLREEIEENVLGGVKIELEDEIIDLSAKNKIKKLQEHLISQEA